MQYGILYIGHLFKKKQEAGRALLPILYRGDFA